MPLTPETKATLPRLIDSWVLPPLRAAGFRRSHKRWVRPCPTGDRLTNVFEVQSHSYPASDVVKFTVNWALHVEGFETLAWGPRSGGRPGPRVASSPFLLRIGMLSDERRDLWWIVSQDRVLRAPAARERRLVSPDDDECRSLLSERLLPLADRTWSAETLLQFVREEASDLGVQWTAGKPDRTTALLTQALFG